MSKIAFSGKQDFNYPLAWFKHHRAGLHDRDYQSNVRGETHGRFNAIKAGSQTYSERRRRIAVPEYKLRHDQAGHVLWDS